MKRHLVILSTLLLGATTLSAAEPTPASKPAVAYPSGYRSWTHMKSMAIHSDKHPLFVTFGGIHHVYVNAKGLAAAKAHTAYPDGSVLVFDLLEANDADGAYGEGARKLLAVMHKDNKKFGTTGGWGFEGFKGGNQNQRLVTDAVTQCFNCHSTQKQNDYVFSQYRE